MWPYILGELAETDAGLDLAPNKILQERCWPWDFGDLGWILDIFGWFFHLLTRENTEE